MLTGARVVGAKRRCHLPNKSHVHLHTGAGAEPPDTLGQQHASSEGLSTSVVTALSPAVQPQQQLRHYIVQLRQLYLRLHALLSAENRARQLYKNISMLFLFPVKDGKLSTGVIAIFDASCYG